MKRPVLKIFIYLMIVSIGILVIHSMIIFSTQVLGWDIAEFVVERFHINKEANLPSWYATVLLFSISAVSFVIYWLGRRLPKGSFFQRVFWLGFSAAYCLLSMDESAQIHELIDKQTDLKWVFVYAPVVGIFFLICAYYFLVVRRTDPELRNWIIGGLIIYAIGGLGFEWVSYVFYLSDFIQHIEYIFEEGLELIGTAMVLVGCLREVERRFEKVFMIAN